MSKEQRQQDRARQVPQQRRLTNWTPTWKESRLYALHRINPQWVTDLNVKCKTVQFLEDNIGEDLDGHRNGDVFSAPKSTAHNPQKQELVSWTSLKLKMSALQKSLWRKEKDKSETGGEKICKGHICHPKYIHEHFTQQ